MKTLNTASVVGIVTLLAGCASPWTNPTPTAAERPPVAAQPAPVTEAPKAANATPETVDPQALASVLSELEAMGDLDADLKQQLIADLSKTKPSLWGATIQVYRGALAFRQQAQQRQTDDRSHTELASHRVESATPQVPASETMKLRRLPLADDAQGPPAEATSPDSPTTEARVEKRPDPAPPSQPAADAVLPESSPTAWTTHLGRAIEDLEKRIAAQPALSEKVETTATLRMLYLAANRRNDALRPIEAVSPTQQDFWSSQFFGLATMVDDDAIPDDRRRAAEAGRHLSIASAKLAEMSSLLVKNLAFCTEVTSFGVYKPFESSEFHPGQEVLLYAEIENFKSREFEQGFETELRSSYQILDSRGQRVDRDDFSTTRDVCQNQRRDFFMRYRLWLPTRIFDGTYTLQLTIEDVKKQETAQASIDFRITEAK